MTLRSLVCHATTAFTLIVPLVLASPARAQDQLLPAANESAVVTVVGCLQRGGDTGEKYVLGSISVGPATSVTERTCTASGGFLELEHENKVGMNESMFGRWVEISGRLEKETSDDPANLRELHVRSFRMVPVIPPARVAAAPTYIAPPPYVAEPERTPPPAAAAPIPEATRASLPKTASPLPAIGLAGLLLLGLGFGLHWNRFDERV